ncbi:DNA-binding transcriptional regulator, GntR family [Raineyella antarctica]|uniref:DNA-binding transcriptional regulator, GntR family n=1 Tax=Raineyella antarctica TaxID=1577474 RepID=A0A1G6HQ89_9ACTN|nr:GntR family transcriptional regulator [Raineyella antarctica]SDB96361.1 DNA-binding transcriptional regulator, GntR family [Raineyella antarctica]
MTVPEPNVHLLQERRTQVALRRLLVTPEYGSMTDAVTDVLREGVLSGLLPPGTWLREGEIAEVLSVSRTPVREALRRLSDEGLTNRSANRGSVVAGMSLEEVLAVYSVRASLEGLAARTAAARRPAGLVDRLLALHGRFKQAVEAGDNPAAINSEFHRAIREASGNAYLERFLVQVENAVRRFGQTTFDVPGRSAEVVGEHYAIIEAIATGNEDLAEERAMNHMRHAREVRLRQMLGG